MDFLAKFVSHCVVRNDALSWVRGGFSNKVPRSYTRVLKRAAVGSHRQTGFSVKTKEGPSIYRIGKVGRLLRRKRCVCVCVCVCACECKTSSGSSNKES